MYCCRFSRVSFATSARCASSGTVNESVAMFTACIACANVASSISKRTGGPIRSDPRDASIPIRPEDRLNHRAAVRLQMKAMRARGRRQRRRLAPVSSRLCSYIGFDLRSPPHRLPSRPGARATSMLCGSSSPALLQRCLLRRLVPANPRLGRRLDQVRDLMTARNLCLPRHSSDFQDPVPPPPRNRALRRHTAASRNSFVASQIKLRRAPAIFPVIFLARDLSSVLLRLLRLLRAHAQLDCARRWCLLRARQLPSSATSPQSRGIAARPFFMPRPASLPADRPASSCRPPAYAPAVRRMRSVR